MERSGTKPLQLVQNAATFHQQGRLSEAAQLYEIIIESDRFDFQSTFRLGLVRLQQGRFGDAEQQFRRAIKIDKKSADAQHYLAIALTGLGRLHEAVPRYEKALALNPRYAEAYNNLGHALQLLQRHERARTCYEKALKIIPDYAEARNNIGNALHALNKSGEAIAHYRQALALRPDYAEAHNNLAGALFALGQHEESRAHCEQALAIRPQYAEAHINLANALQELELHDEAVDHYLQAAAITPSNIDLHTRLGHLLFVAGQTESAIIHCNKALVLKPDHVEALNNLGSALLASGRVSEAVQAFEAAIASAPRRLAAYYNLMNSKRVVASDPHLAALKNLANAEDRLTIQDRTWLHFSLGKALSDLGDYQQAFEHFLHGNSLRRQQVDYDEARTLGRFERTRATFTTELLNEKQGLGDPSARPIFIVGMPRSGTTLIEQILASHPKVHGAGELSTFGKLVSAIGGPDDSEFPEAIAGLSGESLMELGAAYVSAIERLAPGAERITDKMPANFSYVGLIHIALPNARIIHTCRDPRDTALSCFSTLFASQNHTYDLAELGRYLRSYLTLMEHWRSVLPQHAMLDVQYEDIVDNLEQEARRIVSFCRLDWDDACLAFQDAERPVRTASAFQVRQPIFKSSMGRWRHYEEQLQPLLQALDTPK